MFDEKDKNKQKVIVIRENPLYNYENIVEKITQQELPHITKLVRRKEFEPGIYRLKKMFNDHNGKLLDEYIEILNSNKVMWISLSNEEAKEILGTDKEPIFGTYLNDLRRYWGKHEMSFTNLVYMYVHQIKYIKKAVQTTLV